MSAREKLAAACRAQPSSKTTQLLEIGETVSLIGHPAPVEPGCISLRIAGGFTVSVQEAAVVDVQEVDGLYIATVRAGSSAVVKYESTVTLSPSTKQCSCSHEDKEQQTARTTPLASGGLGSVGGLNEVMNGVWCQPEWICVNYWIAGVRYCSYVYVMVCGRDGR